MRVADKPVTLRREGVDLPRVQLIGILSRAADLQRSVFQSGGVFQRGLHDLRWVGCLYKH